MMRREVTNIDHVIAGIAQARRERTVITEDLAYLIASILHNGQDTALYQFVATGKINEDFMVGELRDSLQNDDLEPVQRTAAEHLGLYVLREGDRPRQSDWAEL